MEEFRAAALEWAPLWLPLAAVLVDWLNFRAQKQADPTVTYSWFKALAWLLGAFAVGMGVAVPGVTA
jgi:hypothetical protein